jgi:hypothetical protein
MTGTPQPAPPAPPGATTAPPTPAAPPAGAPPPQAPPTPAQAPAAGPTPDQLAAYQTQVQTYFQSQLQAAQASAAAERQLHVALARAGVHHDGYAEYLATQYGAMPAAQRPAPDAWVAQARAQHPAFFGAQAPVAPAAPPIVAPPGFAFPSPTAPPAPPAGALPWAPPVAPPAPAPPPSAPPGWAWGPQGWYQTAPPAPAAPPGWTPPAPPAPPAPAQGWPQMVRPNPDAGAQPGGTATDPPLSADLILKMDQATFMRRWPEIDRFQRAQRA